jgi:tRNA (mo5U34)-methyltransferase
VLVVDAADLQAQADSIAWFHSIDLGNGVTTKGLSDKNATVTAAQLPDFSGKTVLDIGAWDGYYSFLAERNGATHVVSLDHYAWGVDIPARERYWNECRENGVLPDHSRDTTDFWRADLPGRRGFDFAHAALSSKVESVVADFTTVDVGSLGSFDVVLYLGVLYHMKEPLTCLERLRAVTHGVAVIETAALRIPQVAGQSFLEFHSGSELNRDFGNWFQPNIEAVQALALAAGFSKVEIVQGPPPVARPSIAAKMRNRLTNRAAPVDQYRAIVHAFA